MSAIYGYDNETWSNLSTIKSDAPGGFGEGNYSYTATIPSTGTNPKIYFYFNATDPSNNSADSLVLNYSIDFEKPVIINFTSFNATYRGATTLWIYSNVSDNSQVFGSYLNWSKDNMTWCVSKMEVFAGSGKLIEFRRPLAVPQVNTTYYYSIEAFDEGGNQNESEIASFNWNPPPRISNISYYPPNPNSSTIVTVNASVTDADNVAEVWVMYSTDKIDWIRVNATSAASNWSAGIGPISGSLQVYYRFMANDTEGGLNSSSLNEYYVDGQLPNFESIDRHQTYPGPTTIVNVTAVISDDSNPLAVFARYGYDNQTWFNLTTIMSDAPEGSSEGSHSYGVTIPSAGTNSKVYYFFNATDPSNNSANSQILNYSIDHERPEINNLTTFNTTYRGASTLWIYTNITDDSRVLEAFFNSSTDNKTWLLVKMDVSSGSGKLIEFKSPIETPKVNTTFYYKIEAFDEGRNLNVSYDAKFDWNPPPQIRQFDYYPEHPNNQTSVNITATIWDDDGVSSMWIKYSTDQEIWTTVNGSNLASNWSATIPNISANPYVYFRIWANDLEEGMNLTIIGSYHIDETLPEINEPRILPEYPNASVPVLVEVQVTDFVGARNATLNYSLDEGGNWTSVVMTLTADMFQGQIPPTGSSITVLYRIHTTDLSNLSNTSSLYNFTTDSIFPKVTVARGGPSPPVWDCNIDFPVWINITDDEYIGGAYVRYSYDNESTWSDNPLEQFNGNETNATWSGYVPAPGSNAWVTFHYVIYDRAHNMVRHPTGNAVHLYYASDLPAFFNVSYTPPIANTTTITTVTANITDLDGIGRVELYHRVDFTEWTSVNMSRTMDDEWSANITSPGSTSLVYFFIHAHDMVGLYNNSTTQRYLVDATPPSIRLGTKKPDYVNASVPVTVKANVEDLETAVALVLFQYRFGNVANFTNLNATAEGGDSYSAIIPSSGFGVWAYYRVWAIDDLGNIAITGWASYYIDDIKPTIITCKHVKKLSADEDVYLTCKVIDEWAIDRASVFYSYEGAFHELELTRMYNGETILCADGYVPSTRIPMNVSYYFKFWDMAGNWNTTIQYNSSTMMDPFAEGINKGFDANRLECPAGYKNWEWDFDYSGTFNQMASGAFVNHAYFDDGLYTVALRVTDKNDVVELRIFEITVLDLDPSARILPIGIVYESDNIPLDGSSQSVSSPDLITSFEWDIDYNGVFKADATGGIINYVFAEEGECVVALRVTDDDGSTNITSVTIDVLDRSPTILVDYLGALDEGALNIFNASNTTSAPDTIDRFEWDFDYSGTFQSDDTGVVVSHTYMDDGIYRFYLRAYDSDSYSEFVGTIVVQDLPPFANFTIDSVTEEGIDIIFNGTISTSSPDDIVLYEWDFNYDTPFNTEAIGSIVTRIIMISGTYTIALRVTDDDGSRNLRTMDISVDDRAPSAALTGVQFTEEGTVVEFNASESTSYPDEIVKFEWDFDYIGGTFHTDIKGKIVSFAFMDDGTYIVALRVTDDDGSTNLVTHDIFVSDLGPTASFVVDGWFMEGYDLRLDGTRSESYPDEIVSIEWDIDFVEGSFTTDYEGEIVIHCYLDDGTYIIALRVIDEDGTESLVNGTATIFDMSPTVTLVGDTDLVDEGTGVKFNANVYSTSDEIIEFRWDWNGDWSVDETTQTDSCRHTYTQPGSYNVILTVVDDDGSMEDASFVIEVLDVGPKARVSTNLTPEGSESVLSAWKSTEPGGDFASFKWDIDEDGVWDGYGQEMVIGNVWTTPGMYEITLEVEDADGSIDRAITLLIVTDVPPVAHIDGPVEIGEGEVAIFSAKGSTEPGSDFALFKWDMDNNGHYEIVGPEPDIEWTFGRSGTHQVRLVVEDMDGSCDEVFINVSVLNLPLAFTIVLPTDVKEGVPATFTITDARDPGTLHFKVSWYLSILGDVICLNGIEVTHTYADQGNYQGYVTVEDNDGYVLQRDWQHPVAVSNVNPIITSPPGDLEATEDEQFKITVKASDVVNDKVTFSFKGPGGDIDEDTGKFTWTPRNGDVGENTFTFIATDDDGGIGEIEVTITVKNVDNDFFGASSMVGLMVIIVVAIIILTSLYFLRKKS